MRPCSTASAHDVRHRRAGEEAQLSFGGKRPELGRTAPNANYFVVASYRQTPELNEYLKNLTFAPGRSSGVASRVSLEGKSFQIADVLADSDRSGSRAVFLPLVTKTLVRPHVGCRGKPEPSSDWPRLLNLTRLGGRLSALALLPATWQRRSRPKALHLSQPRLSRHRSEVHPPPHPNTLTAPHRAALISPLR